jgi:hypothetical protein
MRDFRTRVLLVRFTSDPDVGRTRKDERIRFGAVILYPPEVKRQLATLEAATARAIDLARQIIQRQTHRPPDLDALRCAVEVTRFDLRPFAEAAWTQEDGTKVWVVEAEQPLPFGWAWRR